jgi:hypothetical protein
MGGERETTSPQKITTKGTEQTIGTVRYHEKDHHIHFHDDTNGLKVTIPAAQWLQAYQEMENNLPARKTFIDQDRKTTLYIHLKITPKKPKKNITPKLTATFSIHGNTQIDPEYSALRKFTYGT